MNKNRIRSLLTALLFAISASLFAETPSTPSAQNLTHMPPFSWDTVPTAMPGRRIPPYTDEDYSRVARHYIANGGKDLVLAEELKKFNPNILLVGYKNLVLHIQTTNDPLFRDHPDWFLYDSRGTPKLNGRGRYKRPYYDLRKPEVRRYWVEDVGKMLSNPLVDGLFLDAYAKVLAASNGLEKDAPGQGAAYTAGYHQMMEELLQWRKATYPDKVVIGNFLRADKEECAIPEVVKYLDGSYLEGFIKEKFTRVGPQTYEEYVARGIEAVQQVAQAGKIIVLRLSALSGPEDLDDAGDVAGARKSRRRADGSALLITAHKNLEYKLAIFLICAEQYSYFSYLLPQPQKTSEALAPDFPEFRRPLGPPKGPAVKKGFAYAREFQYASVWLDLTKRQGRITWKASYPQAKMLSPRHGDDQVPTGAFQCRIEFDRPIKKGSGSISLSRMSDRQKLVSVTVDSDAVTCPDDKTAVIAFPVGLEAGTQYSILVEKGAFCDQNKMKYLGTPVLGEWKFTTR